MRGITPAVALVNPKYPHNVGAIVRTCSAYGIAQLWWSGTRVSIDGTSKRERRLPREERMRGYHDVDLIPSDRFFDAFTRDVVPVAVEVRDAAESLIEFEHPEQALYVFGPEDGSLDRAVLGQCHRFLIIPSRHCLNLATAVATVLYDRHAKRVQADLEYPYELVRESLEETG